MKADNEGWHLKPETTIVNGPFKLEKREQGRLEYVPNEHYWDAGTVKLDRLIFTMVEDINTELTMFENKEIDMTHDVPGPEIPRLKEELPDELNIFPYLGTYYYIFNCEVSPLMMSGCAKTTLAKIVSHLRGCDPGGELPSRSFLRYRRRGRAPISAIRAATS